MAFYTLPGETTLEKELIPTFCDLSTKTNTLDHPTISIAAICLYLATYF